jgi:hypothetical protein
MSPTGPIVHCEQGDHTWVAFFLWSGHLAYWRCERCGIADRQMEPLPEPLDSASGWIRRQPKLTAQGARPPVSARRWATTEGAILFEGDPSTTNFSGVPIPGLVEAHSYQMRNEDGSAQESYEPSRERLAEYSERDRLTRFQVVGEKLVRFDSYCYEESTFDTPNAAEPERVIMLSGLRALEP